MKEFDYAIVPYENEKERGLKEAVSEFKGKTLSIFIGPEGGFEPEEIDYCLSNGVIPVTLGRRILRTETAGMTTVAILLYELG